MLQEEKGLCVITCGKKRKVESPKHVAKRERLNHQNMWQKDNGQCVKPCGKKRKVNVRTHVAKADGENILQKG